MKVLKKRRRENEKKPVTVADLTKALKPIYGSLGKLDGRIGKLEARMESKFAEIDRRFLSVNIRIDSVERSITGMHKEMREQFNVINSHIDAFMKRTEENKQHDDLAKYCGVKIAYPTYGRNL